MLTNVHTAQKISKDIAVLLHNPHNVASITTATTNISPQFGYHPWSASALSHGLPGNIHLLSLWRDYDSTIAWQDFIHMNLSQIQIELARSKLTDISLYSGWTGIASSVLAASQGGAYYTNFLTQIHQMNIDLFPEWMNTNKEMLNVSSGVTMQSFDIISGGAGIGRYFLKNLDADSSFSSLEEILKYLIQLTEYIRIDSRLVPGWYTPSKFLFHTSDQQQYPEGYFNCGLAHGIPGPLALLSIAFLHGIEVPHQIEAISTIVEWLIQHKKLDENGYYWPHTISWSEHHKFTDNETLRGREAWCYGTPGVASALYLAGQALNNQSVKQLALEAFIQSITVEIKRNQMNSTAICHGLSGLLVMTWQMLQKSQSSKLNPLIIQLTTQILERYNNVLPLGYRDPEPDHTGSLHWLDKAGLLEGVAGIAATLLSITLDEPSNWDYLLLLS